MTKKPRFDLLFSTYALQDIDKKATGDIKLTCPFEDCNKEEHFECNMETGLWHCYRCDRGGNARTFLTLLHQEALENTTDNMYTFLTDFRGIPEEIFKAASWAYDQNGDRWFVPYFTYDPLSEENDGWSDMLNNLGYFYPSNPDENNRYKIKKAAAMPMYLYNPGLHYTPTSNVARILEGEWDTLAYYCIAPDTPDLVLGKPGGGFPVGYLNTLANSSHVHTLLDNDTAGIKQTAAVHNTLISSKRKFVISIHDWALVNTTSQKLDHDINDIRDLWLEHGTDAEAILSDCEVEYDANPSVEDEEYRHVTPGYVSDATQFEPIENYQEYFKRMRQILYLTAETELAMVATLAVTSSINITGEPLWMFLIGPPSCGKTTFIESFGGNNQLFDNLSKLTAKSLVSGWKDEGGEEPSYLDKLFNKTLFVKDLTVTLMEAQEAKQELFGLLTDVYDGHVKIPYGNNELKEFHTRFNMIAGVTDVIHQHSSASIGERFLRCDYLGRSYDREAFAYAALDSFGKTDQNKETLTENTLGFVSHLQQLPISLEIPHECREPIVSLAEFIATMRTKVEKDRRNEIQYRPRTELGPRLVKQLAKTYVCSRQVYDQNDTSEEAAMKASGKALKVIQKIAMDTCYGFPLDVIRYIVKNPCSNLLEISQGIKVSKSKIQRVIDDLATTEVVFKVKSGAVGIQGGRPSNFYQLSESIHKALTKNPLDEATNNKSSVKGYSTNSPSRKGTRTRLRRRSNKNS